MTIFLLCITSSCKKDNLPATNRTVSREQAAAMQVLKAHSTTQEFNDMNWDNVQVSSMNGRSFLLRIKSKSDASKVLLYSKMNGVIHARWTQSNSGSVTVGSLNETRRKISFFKNGRIYASRLITGNALSTTSNNQPAQQNKASSAVGRFGAIQRDDVGDDDLGSDDGTFDGGDYSTSPDDQSFDQQQDGGSGDDPADIAYTIALNQVNIVASPIYIYSLAILMDDMEFADYYTTNPNDTALSDALYVPGPGTINGVDPNFKPGQKSGTPLLKYLPISLLLGFDVSFGYNITTVNGVTTISVTNMSSGIIGNTIAQSWSPLSSNSSITGSVINFTVTGNLNYVIGMGNANLGTVASTPWVISGTYDTSTGAYTISEHSL